MVELTTCQALWLIRMLWCPSGYCHTADLWSLGVLLFEMINSFTPFEANNPLLIYKKISNAHEELQVQIPSTLTPDAKDLIERLLNPNPAMRLGKDEYSAYVFLSLLG